MKRLMLFARPSVVAADSPALAVIREAEETIVGAIEAALAD